MQTCFSGWAACPFESVVGGDCVDVTGGADAAIASEDLVAEIAGIGAETPLVDAVVRAERAAAFSEDFEFAPATEREVVGVAREDLARGAAAGEGAGGEHAFSE